MILTTLRECIWGCRTANGFDINFTMDYFLDLIRKTIELGETPVDMLYSGAQKDGRGNICPVTIILPTIAMQAKEEFESGESEYDDLIDIFMNKLDKKIYEGKDMLIERFDHICSQSPKSAKFMWENSTMLGYVPKEGLISAMKHGTLALGQIGLAETLQILIGCDQTVPKGLALGEQIEKLFATRCDEFKQIYKLNFGVYYSPAESLCRTSYKKFVDKYGLIKNVTAYVNDKGDLVERGYFTNSVHVPVWKKISPFEKIDIESKLDKYSSAGCITYIELDDNAVYNEEATRQIIDYMLDKDCPYCAINVPDNRCCDCGYKGKLTVDKKCPKCGSANTRQLGRVTGYLTGDIRTSVNIGKQMEFGDRHKHSDELDAQGLWNGYSEYLDELFEK